MKFLLSYLIIIAFPWLGYPAILKLWPKSIRPHNTVSAPKLRWMIITAGRGTDVGEHLAYMDWLCSKYEGPADAVYVDDGTDHPGIGDLLRQEATNQHLTNLSVISMNEHVGKEAALESGFAYAANELHDTYDAVLFLDVDVKVAAHGEPDTVLRKLSIVLFNTPGVAGLAFSDQVHGGGPYLSIEMMIRDLENNTGGLIGAGGMAVAVLADSIPDNGFDAPLDLTMVRHAKAMNRSFLHGGGAFTARYALAKVGHYPRMVRTAMRGMQGVRFVPGAWGWNAKLFCHKHLRWASSILLTLCPLAWVMYPFLLPHFAITHAFILTLMGKKVTKWEQTKR